MNKRYLGAAILAPFLIFIFLGGIYLKFFLLIISLFGMHELYSALERKNIHACKILGYTLCIVYYYDLEKIYTNNTLMYILVFSTLISICIPIINEKYNFIDSALTVFVFLYVAVFFSFIFLLEHKVNGNYLIWLIFISSWGGDTMAYYTGKCFGKHKLCPTVSPNKTIEGLIGGVIGSVLGCLIYGIIINNYGINILPMHYVFMGLLGGILGVFGDLVASSIKRYVEVKDYSNLIPGHGGILDRFDSILFVAVTFFYYITFIIRV